MQAFVLCRVFVQSSAGNSFPKKNLTIAKESVSEVRHIGIQHDGFLLPNLVDAKVQVDESIDGKSDASGYPSKLNSELDDPAMTGPVSAATFECLSGILCSELVTFFTILSCNGIILPPFSIFFFNNILDQTCI